MATENSYCEKCISQIDEILAEIKHKPWQEYDSVSFSHCLSKTIAKLEHLQLSMRLLKNEMSNLKKLELKNLPNIEPHLNAVNDLLKLLNNNLQLEKAKHRKAENLLKHARSEKPNEHFADLERKTFSVLIEAKYEVQRARAYLSKLKM